MGYLFATGIYLILRARTFPVVLGLAVLGYAVNLFLFAMGRLQVSSPAILTETTNITDPLPQALVLTAIVIGFATTALLCNSHYVAVMNPVVTMLMPKKIFLQHTTHVRMSRDV